MAGRRRRGSRDHRHAPGAAPRGARGRLPLRHRRRHGDPPGRRRPDREGPPSTRRRGAHRIGADALPGPPGEPRAAHPVHLQPGRLRRRMPVLRDRRAGVHAGPRDGRDRRPGPPRRPTPGRRGSPADEHRVHGHGRAAAQPRSRAVRGRGAQRSGAVRPRGAPHHGLHVRGRARDPAAHGTRAAVHAGHLAACRARRAARRARAAEPALAGRRR